MSDTAVELANAVKGAVDEDKPLTAADRQRIEEVLTHALSISAEEFRKYARNLETIRMEDSRKVIDGFHKHLRLTSAAMEKCLVPLLEVTQVTRCSFVECHVEKGAFVPFLKKMPKEITDILITRPLTSNESDEIAEVKFYLPSQRVVMEAWNQGKVAYGYKTEKEGPVKVIVNPYYLPNDADFAQAMHCECQTVEGYPERRFLMYERSFRSDANRCITSYRSVDCPYIFSGIPQPVRMFEDIGFGPVDLTEDGLQPLEPGKTAEDLEMFIQKKLEEMNPEVEIHIES